MCRFEFGHCGGWVRVVDRSTELAPRILSPMPPEQQKHLVNYLRDHHALELLESINLPWNLRYEKSSKLSRLVERN